MRFPLLVKLVLAGLFLLSLTGCMEMKYHLTIHGNGSADLHYHLALDSSLANIGSEGNNSITKVRQDLEKEGFKVTDFSKDGKTGVDATRHFQRLEDIKGLTRFFDKTQTKITDQSVPFTVKRGFLTNRITVNTAINPGLSSSDATDEMAITVEQSEMDQSVLSQIRMSFMLTLPSKPRSHNATSVSKDGKTLEWKLAPDRRNAIKLDVVTPNWQNITLVFLAGMIILRNILVLILRRRKK
jgi:hypothetical protein